MSSSASRSDDRSVAVLFRMSPENRAKLRARATREGFATVQDWLDAYVLGDDAPKAAQKELPMTG